MENGTISDGQITASSQWNLDHAAIQGRLNLKAKRPGVKAGAWSALHNNVNQWLQVDLIGQNTRITRVATQGRNDLDQWVTKYKLEYSNDGGNFQYHKDQGQTDTKVKKTTCVHFLSSISSCVSGLCDNSLPGYINFFPDEIEMANKKSLLPEIILKHLNFLRFELRFRLRFWLQF